MNAYLLSTKTEVISFLEEISTRTMDFPVALHCWMWYVYKESNFRSESDDCVKNKEENAMTENGVSFNRIY